VLESTERLRQTYRRALARLTENITFALHNFELEAQCQRVEQALRASDERPRSILDSTNEGYYEADLAGTYTFVTDAYCRMLGFAPAELLGVNYQRLVDSQMTRTIMSTALDRIYRTGEPVEALEFTFTRRDGSVGVFQNSIQLRRDADGAPIGFRAVARDVTRRASAEEALRTAHEKYRIILENIADAYYEVDLSGNFTFFNAASCRMHGYPEDQLMG